MIVHCSLYIVALLVNMFRLLKLSHLVTRCVELAAKMYLIYYLNMTP